MISLEKDDILKSNYMNLAGDQQLSYKHLQARKFSLKNRRTFSIVSLPHQRRVKEHAHLPCYHGAIEMSS